MRLIDADALLKDETTEILEYFDRYCKFGYSRRQIEEAPTIDAVEVVRCKYCKHSEEALLPDQELWCKVKDTFCTSNWFCADGKRRDEE